MTDLSHAPRRFLAVALAVFSALGPWGPVVARAAEGAKPPALGTDRPEDRINPVGPGDVVAIQVYPVEEYSREVTVQPDGKIELPLIGSLLVKGLTAREIAELLEARYARFVANPKVTVNIRRFSGRRVAILGEVRTPGFYEYRDGMRILEVLSLAGGLTDLAKPSATRVIRPSASGAELETIGLNLDAILRGKDRRNPVVMQGDTIFVPKGKMTQRAQWVNTNILPWITIITLMSSLAILAKDK